MNDLVEPGDDWQSYVSGDPAYLLRVAGTAIREYCGWHIAPSITETRDKLEVGHKLLMLPSLHVTDVASVRVGDVDLSPLDFDWFQAGYIELRHWCPPWTVLTDLAIPHLATVTMTHGYEELPDDVKQVAYELATAAAEMKAGNVTEVASPGFRVGLGSYPGLNLNDDQKDRLSGYRARLGGK